MNTVFSTSLLLGGGVCDTLFPRAIESRLTTVELHRGQQQ
jgi:hypothetical protein